MTAARPGKRPKPEPIVTAEWRDAQVCSNPECTGVHEDLYLRANCHPDTGLRAHYTNGTAVLRLICRECERTVAAITLPIVMGHRPGASGYPQPEKAPAALVRARPVQR